MKIPVALKDRISPTIAKIIANTGWLSAETIFRMGLSLFISVWLARHLGPSLYGTLNYAIAFVALFSALLSMGLQGIVVHDLVNDLPNKNQILGTSFFIKMAGGVLSLAAIVFIIRWLETDQSLTRTVVYIIVASTLFKPFTNTIELWFQSKVRSKFSVLAKTGAFLLVSLLKIGLIITDASLVAFAWAFVAEAVFSAVALWLAYRKDGNDLRSWSFSLSMASGMLQKSWPLLLSAASASIYFKVDQIMLGQMMSDADVGIYSAAVRFSEIWYFLPRFLAASVFPALIATRRINLDQFNTRLQQLYTITIWTGIGISCVVTLLARPLMSIVYGAEYSGTISILQIHVWAASFIFAGVILSKWLILESLFKFSLIRHLLGAVVNVLLNLVLIPNFGGIGAAISTVISYMAASYLACFTYFATMPAAKMITLGFLAPIRIVGRFLRQRLTEDEDSTVE